MPRIAHCRPLFGRAPAPLTALLAALALALLALAPAPAAAQIYPVAKVDGEIISNFDVAQRARLLRIGAPPNATAAQLQQEARDELIDEQLKINETRKLQIVVSDEELDKELNDLAKRNGLSKKDYFSELSKAGVAADTFERRIRVTLAWNKLLRRRHLQKIQPTDGEVDLEMELAAKNQKPGRKIYDIRQLLIALPRGASRQRVLEARDQARAARRQLTSCDALMKLAPKFSKGSGEIGKFPAEAIPAGLRPILLKLKPGQATQPLLNVEGWHIYMVCDIIQPRNQLSKDQVRGLLAMRKAENISRSLVSDLRRDALIEFPK